jgi:hypothetical protein
MNRVHFKTLLLLFFFILCAVLVEARPIPGGSFHRRPFKQVSPRHNAVSFRQVHFIFDRGRVINSDWGLIRIDPKKLRGVTGECSTYVNVFLYTDTTHARGENPAWVVDNLYVPAPVQPCGPKGKKRKACKHKSNALNCPHPISKYFDLRPGEDETTGAVEKLEGIVVLCSQNPLPNVDEIMEVVKRYPTKRFKVKGVVHDAEGDEPDTSTGAVPTGTAVSSSLLIGPPPQPSTLLPDIPPDFSFPMEIFQWNSPNSNAAKNQCVTIAYANSLQYLEDRYNNIPLYWDVADHHSMGYGFVGANGDVLYWEPIPDYSIVANLDVLARRQGVKGFDVGEPTGWCEQMRGILGYANLRSEQSVFKLRHQGREEKYGTGESCDDGGAIDMGDFISVREGPYPTWEWIFDQLQKGRAVVMSFGRHKDDGERTSGHMLRVYGAAKYLGRKYLHTIDDSKQGGNLIGLQEMTWEVADTGGPGDNPGTPDGQLNLDGTNSEIEFAVSIEALPILLVP